LSQLLRLRLMLLRRGRRSRICPKAAERGLRIARCGYAVEPQIIAERQYATEKHERYEL